MAPRASRLVILPVCLLVFWLAPAISAQETSEKMVSQPAPEATPARPAAKSKSNGARTTARTKARVEQQKSLALSLLVSLAHDARGFRDQTLRAQTLARIADGLWEVDPEQSRTLFHQAWEAAETADQDAARQRKEEKEREQARGRGLAQVRLLDLRSEVLQLAAKRDRALGEELLEKLKREKALEASNAASSEGRGPFDLPEAMAQRLTLARQLLDFDIPRALQFADPALAAVTMQGLSFLSLLKEKDASAADQRYVRMLRTAAADTQSDANTVSILSSYVFTPQSFTTFSRDGGTNTSRMGRPGPLPEPTPELREAFFRAATQILMRPLGPSEQDQTTSGIEGKYLIIKRLLPLFERYASKETTELMRGQLAALSPSVSEEARKRDDDLMRRDIQPEADGTDKEQSLLDRIERAKTSAERDGLYLALALRTLEKGDARARDFVEKIEDSELRKQARPYVDVSLVINAIDKKNHSDALRLATIGELTHFQRVWALSQIARQLNEVDRQKALGLLDDATAEARRIDGSDADRPRALIGVANAFFTLDRARAWELVAEAVKAANSTEGFSGEDSRLMLRLQTPNITSMRTNSLETFDLPSVFSTLTKDDYHRAVGLARNFEADSPRAIALISIARAVLSDK
jgi:hypothetical protein